MPRLGLCTAAGSRHVSTIGLSRLLLRFAIVSALSALDAFAQPAGVFVPTGQMNTTRVFGTATLLRDGRVLIAGGIHCNDLNHCDLVATAELFDPLTGVFTRTGNKTVDGIPANTASVEIRGTRSVSPNAPPRATDPAGPRRR